MIEMDRPMSCFSLFSPDKPRQALSGRQARLMWEALMRYEQMDGRSFKGVVEQLFADMAAIVRE